MHWKYSYLLNRRRLINPVKTEPYNLVQKSVTCCDQAWSKHEAGFWAELNCSVLAWFLIHLWLFKNPTGMRCLKIDVYCLCQGIWNMVCSYIMNISTTCEWNIVFKLAVTKYLIGVKIWGYV